MRPLLLWTVLLGGMTVGCNDTQLASTDPAPVVNILSPVDNEAFAADALLEFSAVVSDNSDPADLVVTWSTPAGVVGDVVPDDKGNTYLAVSALDFAEGTLVFTIEAIDPAGQSATEAVNVVIGSSGTTDINQEGAPTVVLSGPSAGAEFVRDEEITFVGTIADGEQAPDTLAASLASSTDGILWEGEPSVTGAVSVPFDQLSVGTHTVTLTAIDDDGLIGTADVTFDVVNDGRPYATITGPAANSLFDLSDTVSFEGEMRDDEDDAELLSFEWESDRIGLLSGPGFPDSNGYTAFGWTAADAGLHLITLRVTDTEGKWASDSILLEVVDPNDIDNDGDGFTPNQGDCDDSDYDINPGAYDICDDKDNNCDGGVNEPWADTYESDGYGNPTPNDTFDVASYLGEIDNELGPIFSDQLVVSGLTLNHVGDTDWFSFFADDDWFDPVNLELEIEIPAGAIYTADLYRVDNGDFTLWASYTLEDSSSPPGPGPGSVFVRYFGTLLDEDEDYFALSVRATTWPAGSCGDTFSVTITDL